MLVNNARLGSSLAKEVSAEDSNAAQETIGLRQRHGYTVHGTDIETAVYRAIYAIHNAGVQTRAATLARAMNAEQAAGLSVREAKDCRKMTEASQDKAWRSWLREVEVNPLYRNRLREKKV